MNLKTIVCAAVVSLAAIGVGTGTAHAVANGQAQDFRLLDASATSAPGNRLIWANDMDTQMCWQVFQSCQFFCGYNEVLIPDPGQACAYACWEDYLSCMGWN